MQEATDLSEGSLSAILRAIENLKQNVKHYHNDLSTRLDKLHGSMSGRQLGDRSPLQAGPLEDSNGRPISQNIQLMGCDDVKVRGKASYSQVLEELGFPVQESTSALEAKDKMFSGESEWDKRRRNALIYALVASLPDNPHVTLASLTRTCMHELAPETLWQFYSTHKAPGSNKTSFFGTMPNFYKAITIALVLKTNKTKDEVRAGLSEVLKGEHTRASAVKYRIDHAEEVQNHLGENSFSKQSFARRDNCHEKRKTCERRKKMKTSSEADNDNIDSEDDQINDGDEEYVKRKK